MKFLTSLLTIYVLSSGSLARAEDLAITHATVYSATEQGLLADATVVIKDGIITAINPATLDVDRVIDAEGKILTPGLIGAMTQIGLVEIGSEGKTRDDSDGKADITFDPSLAFNGGSSLIPLARKGGLTRIIGTPKAGSRLFAGQSFIADLTGSLTSVQATNTGVVVSLGSPSKGSRARELQTLIDTLDRGTKITDKPLSKKDQAVRSVLEGRKPLLIYANRTSDILQVIALKKRFSIKVVLIGAADAVVVKAQLTQANIPVVINPMHNLPTSFDSLHQSLRNAGLLARAGVKVVFQGVGSHYLYQLRFDAGNAVANGMPYEDALAAITANVADVFGLNSGKIAVGKRADLVLWQGDPLDLNSRVVTLWIDGKAYDTETRQDKLRQRYQAQSDLPKAYVK
ncbi:MAG: amidohydrolase [Alphaproteobacteria bacterium]|nr:MAG: amidohydrolase [Alphaproteobacteria bacterium]